MTDYHIDFDPDNDGTFSGDLSPDVVAVRWQLGLDDAYDALADVATAQVTVRNIDRAYSPGVTGSNLSIGQALRIQSTNGGTTRPHFLGIITEIEPDAGQYGERQAVITAQCALSALYETRVSPAPLVDVRADDVVRMILDRVPVRLYYTGDAFQLGETGAAELGSTATLAPASAVVGRQFQTGVSVFAYAGETWRDSVRASRAVAQIVQAERGRFFVNRTGDFVLFNRDELASRTTSAATFDDDMSGLSAVYGADFVNRVRVTLRPRRVGAANSVLWQLGSPQRVPAQTSQRFRAVFRVEGDERVTAINVNAPRPYTDYTVNSERFGGGTDLTPFVALQLIGWNGGSADMQLISSTGQDGYLQAGSVIRGKPVLTGDALTVELDSQLSQSQHGPREASYSLPALTSIDEGVDLALDVLSKRALPRTVARTLTLDGPAHRTHILTRALFDRITVREAQTGQDTDYFIVAEDHRVTDGGASHRVTWTLEPAT